VLVADIRAACEAALHAGVEAIDPPERIGAGLTIAMVRVPGGVRIGLSGQ
jgi:hypothetical protein